MYKIKEGKKEELLSGVRQNYVSNKIGITPVSINKALNGKECSRLMAYAIVKTLKSDCEVEDFFEKCNERK